MFGRVSVFSAFLSLLTHCAPAADIPLFSQRDPEKQDEKDWVDGRWNQTDVGMFLACTIHTPNGVIAKGLSIRVGDPGNATVCYDTRTGLLRAGWTGGFIRFDPARFGLIRPPKPDGEIKFLGSHFPGLQSTPLRYEGLRLAGHRVVLSWKAEGTAIRESPWHVISENTGVFIRNLEINAGGDLTLDLLEEKGGTASNADFDGKPGATLSANDRQVSVACAGNAEAKVIAKGNRVAVTFPARSEPKWCRVIIGPTADSERFGKAVSQLSTREDLNELSRPATARWPPALQTKGQLGSGNDLFAVDTLTVPYENPWKALMFLSGVDFQSNGTAYACSIHGDVWQVTGIDEMLKSLTWRRFATGLFQPLGLRVVGGKILVLGRDQITELTDENNDGEADLYRNFSNLIETSPGGHDYVTCLETDTAGNLYYADPKGVHRISADGKSKETIATGWRHPNGLGVSPTGIITVAPQQGEWTPSSAIFEAKPGGYYGFGGPKASESRPLGFDPPLCWLPHSIDNSSGSQIWVPKDRWGYFGGKMLHLVWGRCSMMVVLRDEIDGIAHGAAIPLPVRFLSGPMRGSFAAHDGHLYIAGCTGWQTSAAKDGALQRVRHTGKTVYLPDSFRLHSNGVSVTFSQPMARRFAEDPGSYNIQQWNYRYEKKYGSDDWSVADPSRKGRDEVEIRSATLLSDERTVFLETSELRPVMQMEVKYNLDAASGQKVRGVFYTTINKTAPAFAVPVKNAGG